MMYNSQKQQEVENRVDNMIGGTYTRESIAYELNDILNNSVYKTSFTKYNINVVGGRGEIKCDIDFEIKALTEKTFIIKEVSLAFDDHKNFNQQYY